MGKRRWASAGLWLLGASIVQVAACSSTNTSNAPGDGGTAGGGGGKGCCQCSLVAKTSGASCTSSTTVQSPNSDNDQCAALCPFALTNECPNSTSRTVTGQSVTCSGTSGPDGSTTGSTDAAAASTLFNAPCKADTDCGAGLVCLKSGDTIEGVGGIPNGMCTSKCSAMDTTCAQQGGTCVTFSDPNAVVQVAYCFQKCTTGVGGAAKCHGRTDQACEELPTDTTTLPVCMPLCLDDNDCPGRKCDSATGLCVDMPTTGLGTGSACTANKDCAGHSCLQVSAGKGVCAPSCRLTDLSNLEGCNYRRTPIAGSAVPVGACYFVDTDNSDVGDLGYCAQLCDAPADCAYKDPSWTCVMDPRITPIFNHGVCGPDQSDAGTAVVDSGTTPPKDAAATTTTHDGGTD